MFAFVRDLMQDAGRRWNEKEEAVVRKELYDLVFDRLGFKAKVNRPATSDHTKPDYLLRDASGKNVTAAFVYPWERWLDGPDFNDPHTPDENPGACVVTALDEGLADWIIVTNGRQWRLYGRKAHARSTNFYEVDLVEALTASGDTDPNEAFRYWWLFFRPEAFQPADDDEGCWLDRILQGSRDYAKRLGDRLKDRVFFTIFPHMAQGFLEDRKNRLGIKKAPTEEELDEIFEATLTLLYRLLFLLYAESRDLLPLREAPYQAASLKKIKEEISEKAGVSESEVGDALKKAYSPKETGLYDRLGELCKVLAEGESVLNVPKYNGGLFNVEPKDMEKREERFAQFLLDHKIPDRHLALAIDRLARDQDERTLGLVFIDYKSLEVRHLGSIYEGLLEFKLKIAEEDLTTKTSKGTEKYVSLSQASSRRRQQPDVVVHKNEVYLSNDKAERKASGSYYTPDEIVEYIVANTIGPVLEEKLESMRPEFRKVRKTFDNELKKSQAYPSPDVSSGKVDHRQWATQQTYNHHKELVEKLFDFKACDPAMGSGHFLVEVVDFVTDRLVKFLSQFPINPVNFALERTRDSILESLGEQGVTVDPASLTDINLLKRFVLKRCVYGVDLNPMAVELAKVSLWLDCFTLGAPLNFLDHHLRCGNSLIGVTFKDLENATQGRLFSLNYEPLLRAINHVLHVSRLADATAADVAQSMKQYETARQALTGYQVILDLLVAKHFGFPEAPSIVEQGDKIDLANRDRFLKSLHDDDERQLVHQVEEVAQQRDRRFFHWEIEFPEIFFSVVGASGQHVKHKNRIEDGSAGFDCIIGNPPWGGLRTLGDLAGFLKTRYSTAKKAADWFALFVEQSLTFLRRGGAYGVVIPSGWQTATESLQLREMVAQRLQLTSFVNLPYDVFPDAYTEAAIVTGVVGSHDTPAWKNAEPRILIMDRREALSTIDSSDPRWFAVHMTTWFEIDGDDKPFFTFWNPNALSIAQKVLTNSVPLSDFCDVQRGITPFHPSAGTETPTMLPALDGELRRYTYNFTGRAVVDYHEGIAEYKPPCYFEGHRGIVRQLISRQFRIQAIVTNERFVVNQSHQILRPTTTTPVDFIVGIVNSRLLSYIHVNKSALALRDDFPKLVLKDTRSFPIPKIEEVVDFDESSEKSVSHLLESDGGMSAIQKLPRPKCPVLISMAVRKMMESDRRLRSVKERFFNELANTLDLEIPADDVTGAFDDLQGKTMILDYLGDYQTGQDEVPFGEIEEVLRRNRRRIGDECLTARRIDTMRASYEKTLSEGRNEMSHRQQADNLIDALVYRLYGLTEDEVRVVEEYSPLAASS